LIVPYII